MISLFSVLFIFVVFFERVIEGMATQVGGKSVTTVSSPTSTISTTPVNAVSLRAVEVPQALQDGEKFIKWDEVGIFT